MEKNCGKFTLDFSNTIKVFESDIDIPKFVRILMSIASMRRDNESDLG